jgi:asparagine synthase (glutamine-hydrolysing)
MTDRMPWRGPDGQGCLVLENDGIGLGHRRLSIIDLSSAGAQPMQSADGRYVIVFNGEIYNYLEIRRELLTRGHVFRSHSDTEVLLQAYICWGPQCLERFVGMFAFAIWNRQTRELFAARDRLGIKPFYYFYDGKRLIFASEIKSIFAVSPPAGIDPSLIDAYMEFGYLPGEETLHRGVKRLLPGHYFTCAEGSFKTTRYWDLSFADQNDAGLERHKEAVEELLTDAVALRLRSDVPLGVFLSGGLDSSAVVALLAPGAGSGLKTFSVAYDFGSEYNETPYAREVAARFQTDHHEIFVSPRQFLDFIPHYCWHMDEPVTEAAAISLFQVSRLARDHVVVCLSGEGADELFAGYDFYNYNLAIDRARDVLGDQGSRALSSIGRRLIRVKKLRKYLALAGESLEKRYRGISSYESELKFSLYDPDFGEVARQGSESLAGFLENIFKDSKGWDPLSRMLHFDTKTWLVDDLLIKADRMSMATSIELRVPFLDHRLVEYAARVPSRYKIHHGETKFLLKQVLQSRLPASVLKRKKMGFPTPLELMFRGELFSYAHDLLLSQKAMRGYFDRREVERILLTHRSGVESNHRELWQLVVLEEWHRQFGY